MSSSNETLETMPQEAEREEISASDLSVSPDPDTAAGADPYSARDKTAKQTHRWSSWLLLALVVFAAAGMYGGFVHRELPDVYHPDEPTNATVLFRMLQNHDPNPHFFNYPSLFFYLHALVYVPGMLFGSLAGLLPVPPDGQVVEGLGMGINRAPHPWVFTLGRSLTIVISLGAIVLLFDAVRRLFERVVPALLAAVLLAVSPTFVENAVLMTPDALATAAVVLVLAMTARVWQNPSRDLLAESYSPWINPQRYRVQSILALDQALPSQLSGPEATDYVITSEAMYGRYAAEPARYRTELDSYAVVFTKLTPVVTFDHDSGPAIRIYRPIDSSHKS